jgi:hypothetical protein
MGLFSSRGDAETEVPLEVRGPNDFFVARQALVRDRGVVDKARSANQAWNAQHETLMGNVPAAGVADAARRLLAPHLPDDIGRGQSPGFEPVLPLSLGLAMGLALPMVMHPRDRSYGIARSGVVRGWLHLVAISEFGGRQDDELHMFLVFWAARMAYTARVNLLEAEEFTEYVRACGARAGELAVPA